MLSILPPIAHMKACLAARLNMIIIHSIVPQIAGTLEEVMNTKTLTNCKIFPCKICKRQNTWISSFCIKCLKVSQSLHAWTNSLTRSSVRNFYRELSVLETASLNIKNQKLLIKSWSYLVFSPSCMKPVLTGTGTAHWTRETTWSALSTFGSNWWSWKMKRI